MIDHEASTAPRSFVPPQRNAADDPWSFTKDELTRSTRRYLLDIEGRRRAQSVDSAKRAKDRPAFLDTLISPTEFGDMPEVKHMIQGVLTQNSYALLTGRDSTFKTFTALDWALCLATGTPWLDKEVQMPDQRWEVLYVASEGSRGIIPRIAAWEHHNGIKLADCYHKFPETSALGREFPDGVPTFRLRAEPINLFDPESVDQIVNSVARHSKIGFVVIDTLRRSSGRAEQNGSDMGVIVDAISRIKEATDGGSVLVIAHTDKNDTDTRGSSLVEDDADIVWHSRVSKGGKIVLVNRKMKDWEAHDKIPLVTLPVEGSLVVVSEDPFTAVNGLPAVDQDIVRAVALIRGGGDTATTSRILSTVNEGRTGEERVSKATVYRTLEALQGSKHLVKEGGRGGGFLIADGTDDADEEDL